MKKTPDRSEPASTGAKRGRKPRTSTATDDVDVDAEADDRVPAKKRKSAGNAGALNDGDAENSEVHDMAEYAGQRSWEGLVQTIDTVERDDDENLTVYFRLYVLDVDLSSYARSSLTLVVLLLKDGRQFPKGALKRLCRQVPEESMSCQTLQSTD